MKRVILFFAAVIPTLGFSGSFNVAQSVTGSVASCTSENNVNVSDELGIKISGANASETKNINRILNRYAEFSSVKPLMRGATISVVQNLNCGGVKGAAGCTSVANGIRLSPTVDGVAFNSLPHELGLWVMAKGGYRNSFEKLGPCNFNGRTQAASNNTLGDRVTTNGGAPVGQWFAESFAAFVFTPAAIEKSCPAHYNFMLKNVFKMKAEPPCEGGSLTARTGIFGNGAGSSFAANGGVAGVGGGGSVLGDMGSGAGGFSMQGIGELAGAAAQMYMMTQVQKQMASGQPIVEDPSMRDPASAGVKESTDDYRPANAPLPNNGADSSQVPQ